MATEAEDRGPLNRIAEWVDSRLGLSHPLLRPVPGYAMNPFAWLGALTVVAFAILAITGIIMMLYYVPTPTEAYSSTSFIFNQVAYGRFIETVHLYTAYAMVALMFAHMMRGFFVSVYKKPREMMWLVGMVMGGVTLGFAFTGYLLPWTVVSRSGTGVIVGMIDNLPSPLNSFLHFLVLGPGGDAGVLLRFYDLHVVVLPAVLLVLLVVKMYMLEAHGISEPVTRRGGSADLQKTYPIFPDVTLYLLEIAAVFGAGMLLVGALFPLDLPPAYTPTTAAQYAAQPDWYFLWLYQILKFAVFEGAGEPAALFAVTVLFAVLLFMPFLDRTSARKISERPWLVTFGAILIAELAVLAYWGMITPGQDIPTWEGAAVTGGTALLVAAASFLGYRFARTRGRGLESP
jgi:ubiquinol-cytochrome c reductase cytochrome b subunit